MLKLISEYDGHEGWGQHGLASFRTGRISYSKVRAMTRVATPRNEEYLLNIAHHGTAAHVERVVSNYRWSKRLEALEEENNRYAHRELSWYMDSDGMWVLKGKFTAEHCRLLSVKRSRVVSLPADRCVRLRHQSIVHHRPSAEKSTATAADSITEPM